MCAHIKGYLCLFLEFHTDQQTIIHATMCRQWLKQMQQTTSGVKDIMESPPKIAPGVHSNQEAVDC